MASFRPSAYSIFKAHPAAMCLKRPPHALFLPLPQLRAYPAVGLYPRSDSLIFKALRYFLLDSALKMLYAPHRGRGLVPASFPHIV